MGIKVWIDQDLCTGDGICTEICPKHFGMHDDGLAYVKEAEWPTIYGPDGAPKGDPELEMAKGLASVADEDLNDVVEAAEDCPGECIFIEVTED